MAWDTAANIVNDAAKELGLITTSISDPFASTDPNIVQLCAFLKSQGQDMVREKDWTHLQKEYTFTTVGGTDTYDLPSDFNNMIDQTYWVRTTRLPVGGPLSPQEWQFLSARLVGVTFTVLFMPIQGKIQLFPRGALAPDGFTIAFQYVSSYWVMPSGQTAPTSETPTAGTDTIWFDKSLMRRAIKLAWLKKSGLDTTAEQQDYDRTLMQVLAVDSQSPIVRIDKNRVRPALLDAANVPITNYGI